MSSLINSEELKKMANQVKEVLPQVPIVTIETDLQVTGNISETITRLLDGILNFQPEPLEPVSSCSSSQPLSSLTFLSSDSSSNCCKDRFELSLNTAAKCFGKTANERIKSFKERKAALIEAARKRYIKKHDLNFEL